ncbi:MAG: hypothetical protein K8M05_19760 [Deltaproteobacteria bacterium]|nr:hypothetical protein [Kofleriaceae bacterium]
MREQRKITDEQEARRCLAAARRTGESAGVWARANGIDGRSLNAWRVNLARRGASGNRTRPRVTSRAPTAMVVGPRAALVELVAASPPGAARYVVHVGELRVEVGDDFGPETLRRIVEVLRAC